MAFSTQIREATAAHHRHAEASPLISRFLRREVKLHEYKGMQARLYPVYQTMEAQLLQHREHPLVRPFIMPELWRTAPLATDLAFLYGPDWAGHIEPTAVTRVYLERIRWVGDNEPGMLLAHVYTRYLGDLSGGQVLKRIVREALAFQGNQGTQFYEFDQIDDVKVFKETFRRRMDDLRLEADQALQIIDESKHVFDLNRALFDEIG